MSAIEATALAKRYPLWGRGGLVALRGVTLTVPAGSAFGLIGPNGAGKTTFIKSILGIVRPTSGSVRVLGGRPDDPQVRARIGYLPERLDLRPAWKPLPFLRSVARLKGLRTPSRELEELLSRVGLYADRDRRIGGFSKGMRQRLGLAAALVGRPDLLVLDEPTDGVDPLGRVEIRHLLEQELARGATVFLNSHLLAETERICDRVGILDRGELRRQGLLRELTQNRRVWRVRFEGDLAAHPPTAFGFEPDPKTPGTYLFHGEDPLGLNQALDRARGEGLWITELGPLELDLEQVLAETVGANPGAGERR